MKFHALKLFIFVIVLYSASAKRWGGGSSSRGSSSGGRWGSSSKPSRPSAPTSFNTGGKHDSTSSFLQGESGRPSRPRPAAPTSFGHATHSNPPYPTGSHSAPSAPSVSHYPSAPVSSGSHHPSAPSFPSNTHVPSSGKVVHESHQQSHAPVAHNDPYGRQPATNPGMSNAPYVPSGGYGPGGIPAAPQGVSLPSGFNNGHGTHSAPYPTNLPNHPHPNPSIGSSSFPSQPSHGVPSFPTQTHNAPSFPTQTHNTYPQTHSSYPQTHSSYPQTHNSYPQTHQQYPVHGAPPPYHPPQYAPSYYSPPPTAPFVPGRTVIIESSRPSGGSGIGSAIATGVAGGIAAGATNAIVDHAISSIFRSSPHHVHTYPSAPAVGTPTAVTTTTNNYYYGNGGPNDSGNNGNGNAGGNAGGGGGMAQPQAAPSGGQNNPQAPPQGGSTAVGVPVAPGAPGNPGIANSATSGTPSASTNGAVSRTPDGQPEAPPPSDVISDEDIMKFTEELFDKYDNNLYQYVDLNLQKRVTSPTDGSKVPDEAPEPLFNLKSDLNNVATVSTLRALYDNYEHDGTQKESVTESKRNEVTAFIDEVVKTPVMSRALAWLVERKYVEPDGFEQKDLLRRMWFTNFDETSSGFERIFLSEKFGDNGIVGMQNWIYFANREAQNKANYLGYVDMINLSGKGSLLKLNYESEGFTIQNATIFVGTPPELEMALYTVCFHARPNNWCPISIGGAKFFILTHSFRYFGKDLIDLGFPAF